MYVACNVVVVLLLGILSGWAHCASPALDATRRIEEAMALQQGTQARIEAWRTEQEELRSRIRNLQSELRYLRYQGEQYASYSTRQEENIRKAEEKYAGLQEIQRNLEPYLNTVFERLKAFVQSDLPFLPEERKKRLEFIEESLGDYHLAASEKFRRVLEALQVEAEYGRYPEVYETFLELDGSATKVRVLRLGRLALYYATLDGQQAGRYDAQTGAWRALPGDSLNEIKSAIQMIGKSRTPELVNVPIPHGSDDVP